MMELAKDSLDVGILVSNVKNSLTFYQDMLGLKFVEEKRVWFGTLYRLRLGSSDLKLIHPHVMPPKGPVGLEHQLGFRYITFLIKKDLSKLCEELNKNGVEFALPENEFRPGVWVAMVKDPDGNIVELVQHS
jgi:catechol 2,3-dioxygenase-like lactoylglutathione lyase family enzyme